MKHLILAVLVTVFGFSIATIPVYARAVVAVGVGGCCGYSPYYSPYYYGYPAYYSPPPTVIYTQPPVTYIQPQVAATVIQPQQVITAASSAVIPTTQDSSMFVDNQGRTCRRFQSLLNGAPVNGTACLQPDGSWRTVDE